MAIRLPAIGLKRALISFCLGACVAIAVLLIASFWYRSEASRLIRWIIERASPVIFPASFLIPGGPPTRAEAAFAILLAVAGNGGFYALLGSACQLITYRIRRGSA